MISVADGDTITILTKDKKQVRIRLYGIDCPEKSQAFGKKAKKFSSELVYGNHVRVKKAATEQEIFIGCRSCSFGDRRPRNQTRLVE